MIKTNTAITIMKPGAIIPTDTVEKVIYGKITEIMYSLELGGINVSYIYYNIYDSLCATSGFRPGRSPDNYISCFCNYTFKQHGYIYNNE